MDFHYGTKIVAILMGTMNDLDYLGIKTSLVSLLVYMRFMEFDYIFFKFDFVLFKTLC